MNHPNSGSILRQALCLVLIVAFSLLTSPLSAQRASYPPDLSDARAEIYRSTDDIDLNVWIFEPAGHSTSDQTAAIVFFFGGGWNAGSPGQFKWQARWLASRGMVGILADYRVKSRNGTLANVAVSDAKAAIRWVRTNADRLGVDPDRIAAAGGSAGGHLAAATALLPGHDIPRPEQAVSALPEALVLFNPVLVTAPMLEHPDQNHEKLEKLAPRLGADPESMSPYHNIRPGLPPTIIFHGTADKTVPFESVELFNEKMISAGNSCELVAYEDKGHGFFNHGRSDNSAYNDTVRRMDEFLVSLGWLPPGKTE
jgi:acetyl esterase/lipase